MLAESTPIYCNGICSSYGVGFVMQGDGAFTDYKKVVIPQINHADPWAKTMAMGFTLHECGHIRDTDPLAKSVFFSNGSVVDPLGLSFYRAIEDVRMERSQWSYFQGAKRIFNSLVTSLVSKEQFEPFMESDNELVTLQKLVLYFSRGLVAQQKAAFKLVIDGNDVISRKLPAGVVVRVKAILGTISNIKSTQESVEIAQELCCAIDQEIEEAKKTLGNDSTGIDDASPSDSDSACGQQELAESLGAAIASMGDADGIATDVGDIVSKMLGKLSAEDRSTSVPIAIPVSSPGLPDSNLVKEANGLSNVLRTRLLNYLEELSGIEFHNSEDGDELDDLRAAEILLGETDVFLERVQQNYAYDTAVHVLLDRSYSMDGQLRQACVAALGITLTLDQVDGISCSATAFPAGDHDVVLLSDGCEVRSQTQRFNITVNGYTPMASAIWQALQMLFESDQKRKILIVVTDGQPNQGQYQATKDLLRDCELSGVEVIGVGIGDGHNVEELFYNSVAVNTVQQLPIALFGQLQKLLAMRAD